MVSLIQTGIKSESYKKLEKLANDSKKSQYKILQEIVEEYFNDGRNPKNQNGLNTGTTPAIKLESSKPKTTIPEGELGE